MTLTDQLDNAVNEASVADLGQVPSPGFKKRDDNDDSTDEEEAGQDT